MAKKDAGKVELKRGPERQKGPRWGLIIGGVLLVALIGGLLWLLGPRLRSTFEAESTLPPPIDEAQGDGLLYANTFESLDDFSDWELFDDSVISAQPGDGQLVVSVNAVEDTGTWSGLNYTFDDFEMNVNATKIDGPDDNGITVVFRLTDLQNYNRFDISSDGYYALSMVREGTPSLVSDWGVSAAILPGNASNHIRITAVGDTFTFSVNGEPLALCLGDGALWDPFAETPTCLGGETAESWQNGDLARGKIGLGVQGFVGFDGENDTLAFAVIGFDDLLITTPQ